MVEIKREYRSAAGDAKRTMIWEDNEPEIVHVYTEQDMAETIRMNKAMRELHPQKSTTRLLARGVPITVAEQSIREQWDDKDWAKWLDDPDNAAFRVWPGRVGK
jgi:hypothetical protein